MSSVPAMPPAKSHAQILEWKKRKGKPSRWAILIFASAVACLIALVFGSFWPFSRTRVVRELRQAGDSDVRVGGFRRTYFPAPGCILEQLVFHHGTSDAKPLIAIEKLTIRGSYLGLLTRHLSKITAEGMVVSIAPFGSGGTFRTTQSSITTDEIVANGAVLEFVSGDPKKPPLRFEIHEASLKNVGWKGPLTYRVKVHNPQPPGEVTAQGKFGVWNTSDAGQTPISGEYKFENADLSVYDGIAGELSSSGKFSGTLAHIDISGQTDVSDFEVKSGGHSMRLKTKFSAYVDATHGDTFLKRVDADFWKTHIVAEGSIANSANGKGKTAIIDMNASNARIEDLLRLFGKKDRPPMSGSIKLHARAEIPPGDQEFLKKVKLRGGFGIEAGTFSKPSTQENVNKLSAGARGEKDPADPETVLVDLAGKVNLQNGTAALSDLSFGVPGATARMQGTYDVINKKIDLRGQLQVDTKISNSETGSKALLLKMIEPFFKKRKKGEVVPVRISGTFEHPTFGLDLADKKAQKATDPDASRSRQ